jgi:hypothetical protein
MLDISLLTVYNETYLLPFGATYLFTGTSVEDLSALPYTGFKMILFIVTGKWQGLF